MIGYSIVQEIPAVRSGLALIERECERQSGEVVGLLVGTCHQPALLYAFPPGPNAETSRLRCSSDPDFDQLLLKTVQLRHGNKVHVLGYWHKHPGRFTTPSLGDLRQAVQMVKKEGWDLSVGPLLVVIVTRDERTAKPAWKASAFKLRKDLTGFDPVFLLWLDENHEKIIRCLESEKVDMRIPPIGLNPTALPSQFREPVHYLETLGFQIRILSGKNRKQFALYVAQGHAAFAFIFSLEKGGPKEFLVDLGGGEHTLCCTGVQRQPGESIADLIIKFSRARRGSPILSATGYLS